MKARPARPVPMSIIPSCALRGNILLQGETWVSAPIDLVLPPLSKGGWFEKNFPLCMKKKGAPRAPQVKAGLSPWLFHRDRQPIGSQAQLHAGLIRNQVDDHALVIAHHQAGLALDQRDAGPGGYIGAGQVRGVL